MPRRKPTPRPRPRQGNVFRRPPSLHPGPDCPKRLPPPPPRPRPLLPRPPFTRRRGRPGGGGARGPPRRRRCTRRQRLGSCRCRRRREAERRHAPPGPPPAARRALPRHGQPLPARLPPPPTPVLPSRWPRRPKTHNANNRPPVRPLAERAAARGRDRNNWRRRCCAGALGALSLGAGPGPIVIEEAASTHAPELDPPTIAGTTPAPPVRQGGASLTL